MHITTYLSYFAAHICSSPQDQSLSLVMNLVLCLVSLNHKPVQKTSNHTPQVLGYKRVQPRTSKDHNMEIFKPLLPKVPGFNSV